MTAHKDSLSGVTESHKLTEKRKIGSSKPTGTTVKDAFKDLVDSTAVSCDPYEPKSEDSGVKHVDKKEAEAKKAEDKKKVADEAKKEDKKKVADEAKKEHKKVVDEAEKAEGKIKVKQEKAPEVEKYAEKLVKGCEKELEMMKKGMADHMDAASKLAKEIADTDMPKDASTDKHKMKTDYDFLKKTVLLSALKSMPSVDKEYSCVGLGVVEDKDKPHFGAIKCKPLEDGKCPTTFDTESCKVVRLDVGSIAFKKMP
jgi:hypothetical protein